MTVDEIKNELVKVLQIQHSYASSLLETIRKEQLALAARDIPALELIASTKVELTEKIELSEIERSEYLKSLSFAETNDGMSACLSSMTNANELIGLWHSTLENLRACRDGNLTNGAVLELGRRQAENALSILRQHHAPNETYGSQGQKATAFGNRDLGKA